MEPPPFSRRFSSSWSSPWPPNDCFPCWAAHQQSGSPAWSSFRRHCSSAISTRTGSTAAPSHATRQGLHIALLAAAAATLLLPTFSTPSTAPPTPSQQSSSPSLQPSACHSSCSRPPALCLQLWLARREDGPVWYRLFALSNAGSLLALLAYPTLVEPNLTLKLQRSLWGLGFARLRRSSAPSSPAIHKSTQPPSPRSRT